MASGSLYYLIKIAEPLIVRDKMQNHRCLFLSPGSSAVIGKAVIVLIGIAYELCFE
jgi:hypothetical protein